ncbi:imidazole glycerol phosphate synthase subunit HisH [Helcobacillus massiliensis]
MDRDRQEEEAVSPAPRVVVLDHGSGNVRSAVRALEHAGAAVELTADPVAALEADGLVVPGVGAFDATMRQLRAVGAPRIIGRRLAGGRPVLGICVGLQVMFDAGSEHGIEADGLGEWPGRVERLQSATVPHMGWNTIDAPAGTRLFAGVEDERFYFVHSYGVRRWEFQQISDAMTPPQVTWAAHEGDRFIAAVENGALCATQFHPEKSGQAGIRVLRNWLSTLPQREGARPGTAEAGGGAA